VSEGLLDRYDAMLLDLDGTVYRGAAAVDGAAETVKAVRDAGVAVRFVTNNASRPPKEVAAQLVGLGVPAAPDEVSTSAQAAASVLAERLTAGTTVLVVGAAALVDEVRAVGLRVVREAGPDVAAVVQGLSRELGWRELSEACLAVRAGAFWVACNVDATLPTERGEVIGNGALVAAVATATGARPAVAGKPSRPLLDQASRAAGARNPLVVGDRLDTDIAGAVAAEMDSLLVLSGVSRPTDLLGGELRPRYLAADLTALTEPAAELEIGERGEWTVTGEDGTLRVRWQGGDARPDPLELLRALCAAGAVDPRMKAEDEVAGAVLTELGLRDRLA
jgi:glycerol 3-phosphatase-2